MMVGRSALRVMVLLFVACVVAWNLAPRPVVTTSARPYPAATGRGCDAPIPDDETAPTSAASDQAKPQGTVTIVIDTTARTLTLLDDGKVFKVYRVAVGTVRTPTPIGDWRVVHKDAGWGGGFGTRWLGLNVPWGIYGIHGTNAPGSIGHRASHGCIRMRNRDVEELYRFVPLGTRVSIVASAQYMTRIRLGLRLGSSGQDVAWLQMSLSSLGFSISGSDARLGPETVEAIRQLERAYRLLPDGIVDGNVIRILGLTEAPR